jgi:hypothetical protein
MLAKLRLDQTKTYELAIAVNKIAHMLIAFANGRGHFFSIGTEQGGIEKWDDFVIEHLINNYEHIQVKRQNTPFSTDSHIRDRISRGENEGELRKLSPLDESIKSLGACFTSTGAIDTTKQRRFTVIVPSLIVEVKRGLTLNDLHSFLLQINSATTAVGLQQLAAASAKDANIITWLKTWCGFTDEAHILHALSKLKIEQVGNEDTLNSDTTIFLATCFHHADIVLERITSYIIANASYTSAITPRPLLIHLHSYLLPSIPVWTQFRKNGLTWEISGTHGRALTESDIEHASTVVPALWSTPGSSIVKYHSSDSDEGTLSAALVRLVLHLRPTSIAHIQNVSSWNLVTKKLVGETLGISDNDFDDVWIKDDDSFYASSEARVLRLSGDHDGEADKLSSQMHTKTWELVCEAVERKISRMDRTALRDAIEARWHDWKPILDADIPKQKELCRAMLHPNAEGQEIQAELRLGPKTVPLIADGFHLLLVVAVCFNDEPNTWENIDGQFSINVKALCYWSGPAGYKRRVRKLDEDGVSNLLGREPAKILVLSKVDASASEILDVSLAEAHSMASSMASTYKPTLVITNSAKLRMLLKRGDITQIREFLQSEFKKGVKAKSPDNE